MSNESKAVAFGASSLAIWANVAIMLVYMFAFIYAAQNLSGDVSLFYWFLVVLSGISVFVTALTRIIVDIAWQMIRKKEALDRARQR